jgi:AraC-like DNA-binding protein
MKSKLRSAPKLLGLISGSKHLGVNRCLNFLAQNFHEPIQLNDLVKVSGMSRRGFCKAFNRCSGANPGTVLRHFRVEHAKRLLIEHDLLLKQVAKLFGYRSENIFCVAFQRAAGIPPKIFQRQYLMALYRNRHSGESPSLIANRIFKKTLDGSVSVRLNNLIKNSEKMVIENRFT